LEDIIKHSLGQEESNDIKMQSYNNNNNRNSNFLEVFQQKDIMERDENDQHENSEGNVDERAVEGDGEDVNTTNKKKWFN